MYRWIVLVGVLAVGCGGNSSNPAGDSGIDGGDAGYDAGCVCSSASTCCDGCHALSGPCDDGLSCSAASACVDGLCTGTTPTCSVPSPECQVQACSEVGGCGALTSIHEGFDCNDGDGDTYADKCASGDCVGTPVACSINNGGCTGPGVTCVGADPLPPTCVCDMNRYTVTATEVFDSTGLIWQRTASASTFTHAAALTHCSGMGGGWRLPTSTELLTIHLGTAGSGPRINGCAFPGTAEAYFWTSTAGAAASTHDTVNFGGCCGTPDGMDVTPYSARCVR
jgi:hypothetical protein